MPNKNTEDKYFMDLAFGQAERAFGADEVPVGDILVKNGKVVAKGYNRTKMDKDPTAHAEMVCLRRAIKKLKNERFLNTVLYVTLEPCAMCAGAIIQARIPQVVFGAKDPKAGACGSVLRLLPHRKLNHRPRVIKGVGAEDSSHLLKSFFRQKR